MNKEEANFVYGLMFGVFVTLMVGAIFTFLFQYPVEIVCHDPADGTITHYHGTQSLDDFLKGTKKTYNTIPFQPFSQWEEWCVIGR